MHTIRLHSAWKRMVARSSGSELPPVSVSLPDASLLQCDAERVIYSRRFHRPTGLSASTAVLLDCGLLSLAQQAMLNGRALIKPTGGAALDVTALLQPYNELQIELDREHYGAASLASAALQVIDRR